MKHLGINKILLLTLFVSLITLSSCKKVVKEASEKATKELSEESTETVAKKAGKMSLREVGKKVVKNMDFDAFIEYLAKEHPSTHESFSNLDKDFQRSIFSEMQRHSDFFENVISSRTLLDKYVVFTKDAPKLANNVSMLRFIASNENVMEQTLVRQKGNIVELFQKENNKLIGKYKDGVLEIVEPFAHDGHTFESGLLRSGMIPNTLYKVKGKMGLSYLIQSDELGRTMTVQARNIDSDDIITNVLRRNQDLNLGNEWLNAFKKIKQSSMGDDIDLNVVYKYADNSSAPKSVKITASVKGKKRLEQSFVNLDKISKGFTHADNEKLLSKVSKKLNIPQTKLNTLQGLMDADKGFADFIHGNPEYNIQRWLNTRNSVNKKLVAKTSKGRMVPNGGTYAGNVYYFNPYLNPQLASRLKSKNGLATLKKAGLLSREDLLALDKMYPDGVPFSEQGFPDFSKVAYKGKDGKPMIINIGKLTGSRDKDISLAETAFQKMGYKWEKGYTWHHVDGSTSLMRVPSQIHQLIDHAGSIAMQ